MLHLST